MLLEVPSMSTETYPPIAPETASIQSHLAAVFSQHEDDQRRIAELEAMIAEQEDLLLKGKMERQSLQAELSALRSGREITVVIDGKIFALHSAPVSNGHMAPEEARMAVNLDKNPLADSFVL
jgi:hypothetical protein